MQQVRAVGAIGSGAPLVARAVVPAEPDAFGEEAAVIVPAPGAFVGTTGVAVKRGTAADVAARLVAAVRRTCPARDALRPAGAGMAVETLAGIAVVVAGLRGIRAGKQEAEDDQSHAKDGHHGVSNL